MSPPAPGPGQASACRHLIAALPDDLAPRQHRRATQPVSPYTAVFGAPAVIVRCGVPVPAHDPMSFVEQVDGVDWLQLPPLGPAEHYVSFHSRVVVDVVVPHAYLPADVLPALSALVAAYGPARSA
ncbi:MAG TPA: DUF3515 family protein [Mycobacteriales bacterium]|nr:DUF3515 family protein [Mycobacteriales bacterium]